MLCKSIKTTFDVMNLHTVFVRRSYNYEIKYKRRKDRIDVVSRSCYTYLMARHWSGNQKKSNME